MNDDLLRASAVTLSDRLRHKDVSPVELVDAALARIDACQSDLNAFITVTHDDARAAAQQAEREITEGRWRGPLHGMPYAAKDMIMTAGVRTTMGSRLLADAVPTHDAVSVARLKAQGAILVGKTTTPEFGHKPFTEGPLFGRTLNPIDPAVTCGGSSGGSAVAVASHQVPLALGTDGGGSIRIPAACCGGVGLKATLGVIPHLDVPDLFSANSYVGPMARTVADAQLMFDAIRGFDRRDPFGQALAPTTAPPTETKGLRVGWMETVGNRVVDPACVEAAALGVRALEEAGAVVEPAEIDFASLEETFLMVLQSVLRGRLIESRKAEPEKLDPTLIKTIDQGAAWTAVDMQCAAKEKTRCFAAVQALFDRFDVLASPTLAAPPLPVGQDPHTDVEIGGRNAGKLRGAWYPYTYAFNLTGHPALTVPCGETPTGLPLALQLVGPWYAEDLLLRLGAIVTNERDCTSAA